MNQREIIGMLSAVVEQPIRQQRRLAEARFALDDQRRTVADGLGVGIVSEAGLPGSSPLLVRRLSPSVYPPIVTKLICRAAADVSAPKGPAPLARESRELLIVAANVKRRSTGAGTKRT